MPDVLDKPMEASTQVATIEVPIAKLPHAPENLPSYATPGSAGMDVRAAISEPMVIQPFERKLIPTGFAFMLPVGYECQIRPRSGLSIKHGITLINCVGTVDSDYRDEVKVPIVNLSQEAYTLQPLERVAQLVIAPVTQARWQEVTTSEVEESKAGLVRQGGFGSTGTK